MGRNKKIINKWARWFITVAMLVHLVVPLGQSMSTVAFASGNDNGIPPLFICSAMGGVIRISEDGNSKVPHNPPTPCSCAFCFYCHTTCQRIIIPPVLAAALPKTAALIYRQMTNYTRVLLWSPTRHRQRAPPSFT